MNKHDTILIGREEHTHEEMELLNRELNDPTLLEAYARPFNGYETSVIPKFFGKFLVWAGNVVYGHEPSYLKFRAVEVIARVPYQSWTAATYTLLTLLYTDEKKAMRLGQLTRFARLAHDNETMHVVVISKLSALHPKGGFIRHTVIPVLFALVYFWVSYILYLVHPKYSYELNYLFEDHAFSQYSEFVHTQEALLRSRPIMSDFLEWYGRSYRSEYEFFQSVRNDEVIHRNTSIRKALDS